MRRLLVLLLLALTTLQSAFAGMPVGVAAAAVPADIHAKETPTQGHGAAPCMSFGSTADAASTPLCDAPQACRLCDACQMCHQAALADSQVPGMPSLAARAIFPPSVSRYLSAEHAPSFKPPIP